MSVALAFALAVAGQGDALPDNASMAGAMAEMVDGPCLDSLNIIRQNPSDRGRVAKETQKLLSKYSLEAASPEIHKRYFGEMLRFGLKRWHLIGTRKRGNLELMVAFDFVGQCAAGIADQGNLPADEVMEKDIANALAFRGWRKTIVAYDTMSMPNGPTGIHMSKRIDDDNSVLAGSRRRGSATPHYRVTIGLNSLSQ